MKTAVRVDRDGDGNVEVSPAKVRNLKPLEGDDEGNPQSGSPKTAMKKSALKGSKTELEADLSPSPPAAPRTSPEPPRSALKSAMKGSGSDGDRRPSSAETTPSTLKPTNSSQAKASPPKSAMKNSSSNRSSSAEPTQVKSAIKSAMKKTDSEGPGSPPLSPKSAMKSAMKGGANISNVPEPPPSPKKSALKSSAPADDASELGNRSEERKKIARPSVFKMNVDIIDPEAWQKDALMRHYYHFAGQKMLWQEHLQSCQKSRKSIRLEDFGSLHVGRQGSSGPALTKQASIGTKGPKMGKQSSSKQGIQRHQSLLIEDEPEQAAPTNHVEEALGEVSPLKEILIAKKPDAKKLRELLEDLPDPLKWINITLDATPPPMPCPLHQAVAGVFSNIVEVLVEFKVNVEAQYTGKSMLKGWIKPMTPLLDCVRGRKARFVGTMLGDKLESIEKMLLDAAAAKKLTEEAVAGEAQQPPPQQQEPEPPLERKSSRKATNELRRKSVQLKGAGRQILHTQGHPDMRYELNTESSGLLNSGVREAIQTESGDTFAIKAGHKYESETGGKDPEAELWNEITLMRKLSHPNVIKLVETFEDETHIFMVFESCTGGELFDRLVLEGMFTENQTMRLAYQMGSAIRHLHELRICHRDIQLETFLLTDVGDLETVGIKLMDFSTAKEIVDANLFTKVCTLHYVAPEILTSKTGYNEKVDIWSFGTLMFVMLAGTPPFEADHELDVLQAIKSGSFSFDDASIWDNVSEDAKDCIRKMLVLDPVKRLDIWQMLELPCFVKAEHETVFKGQGGSEASAEGKRIKEQVATLRTVFQLMSEKLSDKQVMRLRDLFRMYDRQKNGMVDVQGDILESLERLATESADPETLVPLIKSEYFTGKVNYTLSLATIFDRRRHIKRNAARSVFDMFDVDGNNAVSMYEIATALFEENSLDTMVKNVKLKGVTLNEVTAIWQEMKEVFAHEELTDEQFSFEEFFKKLPHVNQDISF